MVTIRRATDMAPIRELWREYWGEQGLTPCFQNFDAELQTLPGAYTLILIAHEAGQVAGSIALRPIDGERAEAKRLYVRPQFRGQGIAAALLQRLIEEARAAGYQTINADTLPSMNAALDWYRRIGFAEIEPYTANPTPGAVYLQLDLTGTSPPHPTS